jgi:hypothetical protein
VDDLKEKRRQNIRLVATFLIPLERRASIWRTSSTATCYAASVGVAGAVSPTEDVRAKRPEVAPVTPGRPGRGHRVGSSRWDGSRRNISPTARRTIPKLTTRRTMRLLLPDRQTHSR